MHTSLCAYFIVWSCYTILCTLLHWCVMSSCWHVAFVVEINSIKKIQSFSETHVTVPAKYIVYNLQVAYKCSIKKVTKSKPITTSLQHWLYEPVCIIFAPDINAFHSNLCYSNLTCFIQSKTIHTVYTEMSWTGNDDCCMCDMMSLNDAMM